MRLDNIMKTIVQSEQRDWHVIGRPTYRDTLETGGDGKGQSWIEVTSHSSVATFIPDASITMAWGLRENDDFREEWANAFTDPRASSSWADVFYSNALVYRAMYVAVDGGRCYLPVPDDRNAPGPVPTDYARFVHLLDRLSGRQSDDFDSFFNRAGLVRMADRPWPPFGTKGRTS